MIVVLLLILFVNAWTRTNGVKPIDDYNIDNNTLRIGKEEITINTYKNIGITEKQSEMIKNIIKNDFLVNDDTIGGTTNQEYPSVSMDNAGNFVIVWNDYRNGNSDIFSQIYDTAGIVVGTNFMVNDDAGTANQGFPDVSMNNEGNFVIVWEDYRNGDYDIYSQRYDSTGLAQGTNFMVNDDVGTANQEYPSVSMNNAGNFVIVWEDYRNGVADIYSQRYDSTGSAQGTNFMVNDDAGTASQGFPDVSMDNAGNFVIVWYDYRNGDSDIYSQRYDSTGTAQGTNFMVNDDLSAAGQHYPNISMDNAGNFVIVWYDNRNGNYDIYSQRYDSTGTEQGTNFMVNDDGGPGNQFYPSVSMNNAGNFVIAWQDYRNSSYDIYSQRYDSTGLEQGTNFMVNDDVVTASQNYPSVSLDNAGNFVIVWKDYRNSNSDIYSQRYDNTGALVGTNFIINDDAGTADQEYPSVLMDPDSNRFIISWTDYRNIDGDPEIMAQKYVNGIPTDSNVQINVDSLPYYHQQSSVFGIACNNNSIIFTWMDDRRAKGWDIYGKLTDWYINTGINDYRQLPTKQEKSGIIVYPNPFYESIMITGGTGVYSIYDISGRLVNEINNGLWNGKDKNGKEIMNGIYYIKSNDYKSIKIIKMR